jgi:hypothetical protein
MNTYLTAPDLHLYLNRIDHTAIHYRAELAINPDNEYAKRHLKLLDHMAVEAIDMHLNGKQLTHLK